MNWPWSKKHEMEAPQVVPANGFFSTDREAIPAKINGLRAEILKYAIPEPIKFDGIGMDDSIQEVKRATAWGQAIPDPQFLWYASQGFIGYQTCAILAQNWLIEKACEMPARDAVRNWFDITVDDGIGIDIKVLSEMKRIDKRMKLKNQCVEFEKFGRIFGIRIAMPDIAGADDEFYESPYNPDGIKPGSYRGMSQIDPYWIFPELAGQAASNPAALDFYEPTFWRVNGRRVHKSHLVIMKMGGVPDLLKPSYLYGGIPMPQKIAERVYAAERTANEGPLLAMTKRLNAIYTDIDKAIANPAKFEAKMLEWARYRDNHGIKVLGTGEKIEQFDTTLNDLDMVIMTQYQLVAAIANVPATKLLGTSPKGFNATGEFESKSYHEELESVQEMDLSPLIERHHELVIRSIICPKFKIQPFDTEISWNPVDSPSAEQQADVNLKNAQTMAAYVNMGVLSPDDGRVKLAADKDAGFNNIDLSEPLPEDDFDDEEPLDDPTE